jgi:hypothetical protein
MEIIDAEKVNFYWWEVKMITFIID